MVNGSLEQEAKALAEQLGVADRIIFEGFVDDPTDAYASSDQARPLTVRGEAEALAAGRFLVKQAVVIESVWVSPYLRAQQTADQVLKSIRATERETLGAITPESSPKKFIAQLNQSDCDNLLVVSHNPFVSSLIGLLCDGAERYGPAYFIRRSQARADRGFNPEYFP